MSLAQTKGKMLPSTDFMIPLMSMTLAVSVSSPVSKDRPVTKS